MAEAEPTAPTEITVHPCKLPETIVISKFVFDLLALAKSGRGSYMGRERDFANLGAFH